jgi:hypothetical protein
MAVNEVGRMRNLSFHLLEILGYGSNFDDDQDQLDARPVVDSGC